MHTINVFLDVPHLVQFISAARHDHTLLRDLNLAEGSFVVFNKGYTDYTQYHQWSQENTFFVTRQKDNASYRCLQEYDIGELVDSAVVKDEQIAVHKGDQDVILRRIAWYHPEQDRTYIF